MRARCCAAALLLLLTACVAQAADSKDATIMQNTAPMPDLLEQTAIPEAMRNYWRQVSGCSCSCKQQQYASSTRLAPPRCSPGSRPTCLANQVSKHLWSWLLEHDYDFFDAAGNVVPPDAPSMVRAASGSDVKCGRFSRNFVSA
jgi:hypothetical protein